MNQIWLQIFATMIGGSIVKSIIENSLVWVLVDVAILGISYVILRRHPNVNLKSSMMFLGGFTAISILMDLRIIGSMIGNIAMLALLGWMMFGSGGGNGPKRPDIRHKWHK